MGNTMPFIDILIFAVIAIFLIFRLRSILGNRDGFEKPLKTVQTESSADNIINFKGKKTYCRISALKWVWIKRVEKA
jgi:hypothetical protein